MRKLLVVPILVVSDLVLAALFWGVAFVLYDTLTAGAPLEPTIGLVAFSTTAWVALRALVSLYPGYGLSPAEALRRQTYATATAFAVTGLLVLAFQAGGRLPVLLLSLNFLLWLLLAPLARYLVQWVLRNWKLWGKPVVVLGAGGTGEQLIRTFEVEWGLGFRAVGSFDFRLDQRGGVVEGVASGGTVADALSLARKQGIDTVVFAMPHIHHEYVAKFVEIASRSFRHVLVVPNMIGMPTSAVQSRDIAGLFAVEVKQNLLDPWSRRGKHALDLLGAAVGGLLISPLLLSIALLIKLTSPGPVLYKHMRLGAMGRHFPCWKFRTMYSDAAQILTELLQREPNLRAEWERGHKLHKDPRITPVGRFLRKSSLDELPQLWNVLRGEMSLVGPRPIVDAEVLKYGEVYELYRQVGPGMTGLWQVSGRSETTYEVRVALDAYYVRNWSVWLDFVILARTVKILIFRAGAY